MAGRRKRLKGAAALSAVTLATILGGATASADGHEVCLNCTAPLPPDSPASGQDNAFLKIGGAFSKFESRMGKVQERLAGVPTQNPFHKIENVMNKHDQVLHKIEDVLYKE